MKILALTNFSSPAQKAVEFAAYMASVLKADLVLLSVIFKKARQRSAIESAGTTEHMVVNSARHNCTRLIKKLKEEYEELNVTYQLASGNPLEKAVEDYALNYNIDLIVMGNNGADAFDKILFGSNTAALIAYCSVPVLSIPESIECNAIKTIVYASELVNYMEELKVLVPLAQPFEAHIHLLHVINSDDKFTLNTDEIISNIKNQIQYPHISVLVTCNKNLVNAIEDITKQLNGDVLAMFTHKLSTLEKLLLQSVTSKIFYHTTIPLLALKLNSDDKERPENTDVEYLDEV